MKQGFQLVLAVMAAIGHGAVAAEPAPLQPGTEVRGEITSSAPLNHSDGSRSELYVVEIGERELVSFDVSGPLRAQLTLFDGEELVARSGPGESPSLALRAPRSAAYTLAVSSADATSFGPYTLSAQVVDGWDGSVLRSGTAILDWVDGSRDLPLQVDRRGMYTIDLRSDQFDTVLRISGNGVDARDDDGGDGTDSRLSVLLEPGSYTLNVAGWSGGTQGLYRLAVASRPVPDNLVQGGPLRADGAEVQGAYQGTPLRYRFELSRQRLVTIDMRSQHFDSLLVLHGNGAEHRDDDGGDGLDARLVRVLEPGAYTIEASAAMGGSGLFTLSLSSAEVPAGTGGGALAAGEARDALLLPDATDRYALTVETAGEYVIDMASGDLDSWLELFDAQGTSIASDDDSGGGLNARIRAHLAPGSYSVDASALGGDGRYRISVSGP